MSFQFPSSSTGEQGPSLSDEQTSRRPTSRTLARTRSLSSDLVAPASPASSPWAASSPNPHPYSIVTSASGVLTRPTNSPKHRPSRSLSSLYSPNQDQQLVPLPMSPAPSSPAPAHPPQRPSPLKRSGTLPNIGSTAASQHKVDSVLPSDARLWNREELAKWIDERLVKDRIPRPIRADIALWLARAGSGTSDGMTGKEFIRGDGEGWRKSKPPPPFTSILLSISRDLRRENLKNILSLPRDDAPLVKHSRHAREGTLHEEEESSGSNDEKHSDSPLGVHGLARTWDARSNSASEDGSDEGDRRSLSPEGTSGAGRRSSFLVPPPSRPSSRASEAASMITSGFVRRRTESMGELARLAAGSDDIKSPTIEPLVLPGSSKSRDALHHPSSLSSPPPPPYASPIVPDDPFSGPRSVEMGDLLGLSVPAPEEQGTSRQLYSGLGRSNAPAMPGQRRQLSQPRSVSSPTSSSSSSPEAAEARRTSRRVTARPSSAYSRLPTAPDPTSSSVSVSHVQDKTRELEDLVAGLRGQIAVLERKLEAFESPRRPAAPEIEKDEEDEACMLPVFASPQDEEPEPALHGPPAGDRLPLPSTSTDTRRSSRPSSPVSKPSRVSRPPSPQTTASAARPSTPVDDDKVRPLDPTVAAWLTSPADIPLYLLIVGLGASVVVWEVLLRRLVKGGRS